VVGERIAQLLVDDFPTNYFERIESWSAERQI
jgi:hypothetical protein